jgi:hypothetical protein
VREGGSNGSGVETAEKSTSGSCLDAREMEGVIVVSGVIGVSGVVMVSHCRFVLVVRLATSVRMGG